MFPNLMAEYENEFPAVEEYLFIGGPKHGQRIEAIKADATHRVITPPAPAPFIADSGASGMNAGFDIHTYVRREVNLKHDDGTGYVRAVFVHEQIPNAQVAQQLLMSALYVDFVKGGRKVIEHDGSVGG